MGRMTVGTNIAQLFDAITPRPNSRGRAHRRGDGVRFRGAARGIFDRRPTVRRRGRRGGHGGIAAALCRPRRQSRTGRPALDVPDRRRPLVAADARGGRKAQAVPRRARDARHRRLSPAGDARRHRRDPRRRRVERRPRRFDGGGLGAHARPAEGPRSTHHLRHDDRIPYPVRTGRDRRPAWSRRVAGGRPVRREAADRLRRSSTRATRPR